MAILTYHHIGHCPPGHEDHRGLWVPPDLFRQQLGWLAARGYAAVTLDAVHDALAGGSPLPRRWVCITFDDGWRDNYTAALPALRDAGMVATVFLISSKLRGGPPAGAPDDFLSPGEVREMQDAGMQFGSHSRTHPRLATLNPENLREELEGSRDELAAVLGDAPRWLCYPYGNFSHEVAFAARAAGYRGATSTIRGNRPRAEQMYWLPRVMIMNDTSAQRLGYLLSFRYHLLHSWKNRKRWRGFA